MAASGKPGWDDIAPPCLPGFVKVPYGDLHAVAAAITDRTCAVMLEPIQGEAGVVVPPGGYLKQLRVLTEQRGVLLVADEIQTGVCRTGPFLHCHSHDIVPDIVTLGKGLGGGVPVAALVSADHCASFELGDHGGTFAGNPLTAAAALAVMHTVCDVAFMQGVHQRGLHLLRTLQGLQQQSTCGIVQIRGAGLLVALRLQHSRAAEVDTECLRLGLLVNAPRPDVLRLMPQLRVSETEVELMRDLLRQGLETVH
jgi:acetylornithine/N-succinyldiaminopimelate aminotransferase